MLNLHNSSGMILISNRRIDRSMVKPKSSRGAESVVYHVSGGHPAPPHFPEPSWKPEHRTRAEPAAEPGLCLVGEAPPSQEHLLSNPRRQ